MSYVNAVVIKDDKLCFFSCHYRTLLSLADKNFERILELSKRKNFLDSGWIVFDIGKRMAVSSQSAFPVSRLGDWAVFEV